MEIKRGDGTYISHSMSNRLFDHLVFQMILSDTDKKKLMELRELIEVGIIKIVIANAQEEDIATIKEEYSRMAERVEAQESDPDVLTEMDLRFHRAIGKPRRTSSSAKSTTSRSTFLRPPSSRPT